MSLFVHISGVDR